MIMFLRKDLNSLLGDNSELACKHCSYSNDEGSDSLLIQEHALIILNRCLNFQVRATLTNCQEVLYLMGVIESNVSNPEIGVTEVL